MRLLKSISLLPFFLLPLLASAQAVPEFPMAFWGTVTINGTPAPVGTIVRAYYGATLAGSVTVQDSGIYGYTNPTQQKLVIGEGVGQVTFTVESSSMTGGVETGGATPITYTGFVTASTTQDNLAFTITPTQLTHAILKSATAVSTATPFVMVSSINTAASTISVPLGVTNAALDVSSLTAGSVATIPGPINVAATTSAGVISVAMPAGITVTAVGSSTWNGVINLPQPQPTSAIVPTVSSGNTASVATVIEVGAGNLSLVLDHAARLLFAGDAGDSVGYTRNGTFTQITATCSSDSQTAGDALAAGADCSSWGWYKKVKGRRTISYAALVALSGFLWGEKPLVFRHVFVRLPRSAAEPAFLFAELVRGDAGQCYAGEDDECAHCSDGHAEPGERQERLGGDGDLCGDSGGRCGRAGFHNDGFAGTGTR